jgi:large subunit ribosomal protein L24
MKIRKGDTVQVVRGKDAGKSGKVERVNEKERMVFLENINQYKRHLKARSQQEPAEIITLTKPLPVANVQIVCPKCKKITRVGFVIEKDIKTRICRKCEGRFTS